MSLTLTVDGDRWRAHLRAVADATPGLVPVAKGNGYGFTPRPAGPQGAVAGARAVDTLAVGTYDELPEVATRYDGNLLVLTPWRPFGAALELDPALARRVVHTVSRLDDLTDLLGRQPDARFVLERATSMLRHGMTARELWATADGRRAHHPKARARGRRAAPAARPRRAPLRGAPADERRRRRRAAARHGLGQPPQRRRARPRCARRTPTSPSGPRIGTDLWLGDRGGAAGDRDRARRARGRARRRRSATGTAPPRRPATSWSSAAAPRTASASRRRLGDASLRGPGRDRSPAAAWTRPASCARRSRSTASSGCSPSRRTCRPRCCSCRTAPGCPRSATRSTCGCATPRRRSTASSSR